MTFKNNNEYIKRGSETSAAKTSKAYLHIHVTGYSFRRGRGGGGCTSCSGLFKEAPSERRCFFVF